MQLSKLPSSAVKRDHLLQWYLWHEAQMMRFLLQGSNVRSTAYLAYLEWDLPCNGVLITWTQISGIDHQQIDLPKIKKTQVKLRKNEWLVVAVFNPDANIFYVVPGDHLRTEHCRSDMQQPIIYIVLLAFGNVEKTLAPWDSQRTLEPVNSQLTSYIKLPEICCIPLFCQIKKKTNNRYGTPMWFVVTSIFV